MRDMLDRGVAVGVYLMIGAGILQFATLFITTPMPIWAKEPERRVASAGKLARCLIIIEDLNNGNFGALETSDVRHCERQLEPSKRKARRQAPG